MRDFPQLFEGLGKLKGKQIKLHIDKTVKATVLRHCRVTFHPRPKVEEELRKLEALGVIEKVNGTHSVVLSSGYSAKTQTARRRTLVRGHASP